MFGLFDVWAFGYIFHIVLHMNIRKTIQISTILLNTSLEPMLCMHAFDTLSLDVGHIQSFFESQNNSTKLEVKGIAEREINKRFTSAEDRMECDRLD